MIHRLFSKLLFCSLFALQSTHAFSEENFLLINGATDEVVLELGPGINERASPACSFNIALSLMGYDAGILNDENTPIWDFEDGYDDSSESWKTSQNPQSWMTRSVVWYSKLLSVQLGSEKIQNYLAIFEYGDQDISGGLPKPGLINPAWISSSLKISPKEQVNFIQKMIQGKLPISSYAIAMTKVLLFKEELSEGWKLYGKTGLSTVRQNGETIKNRWFAGWIEDDRNFFPFAYLMREKEIDVSQVVPRVKQLLIESSIMNAPSDD